VLGLAQTELLLLEGADLCLLPLTKKRTQSHYSSNCSYQCFNIKSHHMSIYANKRKGRRGPGSLLKREERRVYKAAKEKKRQVG
jgi:hypothetical protein